MPRRRGKGTGWTTITLSVPTRDALRDAKRGQENYDRIILRLLSIQERMA